MGLISTTMCHLLRITSLINGFRIYELRHAKLIELGKKALEKDIPQLLASDYMLYYETCEVMFTYHTVCTPESVTDSRFVFNGKTVTFDTSLEYNREATDHTVLETEVFQKTLCTDSLY